MNDKNIESKVKEKGPIAKVIEDHEKQLKKINYDMEKDSYTLKRVKDAAEKGNYITV